MVRCMGRLVYLVSGDKKSGEESLIGLMCMK